MLVKVIGGRTGGGSNEEVVKGMMRTAGVQHIPEKQTHLLDYSGMHCDDTIKGFCSFNVHYHHILFLSACMI